LAGFLQQQRDPQANAHTRNTVTGTIATGRQFVQMMQTRRCGQLRSYNRHCCAKRLTIARAGHGLNAVVLGVRKQEQHDG